MKFLFVYRCVYPLSWIKINYWIFFVHTAGAFDEVVHQSFSALPPIGACVLLPIPQDDQHISPSYASFGLLSLVFFSTKWKNCFVYNRHTIFFFTNNVIFLIIKIYKCTTNLPLLACFKTDTMVAKFGRNIGISSQHILIKSKILRSAAFEGTFGLKGGDSTAFTRCIISEERKT